MIYFRRASCQNSDNQTTTNTELSLTDYEGLFHLMLRLHVALASNEITLIGDYMKNDLLPTDIMYQTTTDIQLSLTDYEWPLHLMLQLHLPQHQMK